MDNKKYAEKLVNEYSPKEKTKLDELKALDKKVRKPAVVFAYIFGVVGALILGVGLCLAMKIIGGTMPFMIIGIVVGVVGIVMVSLTHYIYVKMLNSRKAKYSSEILNLSNELLND